MKNAHALRLAGIALALCAAGSTALAATVTISVTAINFGNYSALDLNPNDSTGTLSLTCSGSPRITARITFSTGIGGSYTPRKMQSGANTLTYNLYKNAARTNILGDGTGGTAVYGNIGCRNTTKNKTIYGRIPAGDDVPVGIYADTITVTATY